MELFTYKSSLNSVMGECDVAESVNIEICGSNIHSYTLKQANNLQLRWFEAESKAFFFCLAGLGAAQTDTSHALV